MALKFVLSLLIFTLFVAGLNAASNSNSITISAVPPPAPTNIENVCPRPPANTGGPETNHITYICVEWEDTSARAVKWDLTLTASGKPTVSVTVNFAYHEFTALTGSTTYTVSIVAYDAEGRKSTPTTATFTTDPADARTDPSLDISAITCSAFRDETSGRPAITCSWTNPTVPPKTVKIRCRCDSAEGEKNRFIRKVISGTLTTVTLPINRSQTTCKIFIVATFANGGRAKRHEVAPISITPSI